MRAILCTSVLTLSLAIFSIAHELASFAQTTPPAAGARPHTETTVNVTLTVTPENYANIRDIFLKACPPTLQQEGEKACDDLRSSASQAMADEDEYIRVNQCDVPADRPVPKQAETHSQRFLDLFDSSEPLASCDDAVYARDVLSKYWPFLAIMGLSDACGFLEKPKTHTTNVARLPQAPARGKPIPLVVSNPRIPAAVPSLGD